MHLRCRTVYRVSRSALRPPSPEWREAMLQLRQKRGDAWPFCNFLLWAPRAERIVSRATKIRVCLVTLLTTAEREADTGSKYVLEPTLRARRVEALHPELHRTQISIEPV